MRLGIGIGWRPEIADTVEALPGIDWVEAVAENLCTGRLPDSLLRLRERGVTVVPHGVALGLGGDTRESSTIMQFFMAFGPLLAPLLAVSDSLFTVNIGLRGLPFCGAFDEICGVEHQRRLRAQHGSDQ